MASDFPGAFSALREMLRKQGQGMPVQADTPTEYALATRSLGPNGQPMWFACVKVGKSAVSYHLMPLYFNPVLQAAVSPELARRKQGKTCFNFQRPDDELFQQLDALTALGRAQWERQGLLEPGPISPERLEAAVRAAGEDPQRIARQRKTKAAKATAKRQITRRA